MDKNQFGGLPENTDSFGGVLADTPLPRKRTFGAVANDTVIKVATAAAGGAPATANFIKPAMRCPARSTRTSSTPARPTSPIR